MATTHREGSVFHHEGGKVTHVETGTAPGDDTKPAPAPEPEPASEPGQAPEPDDTDEVDDETPARPAPKKAKATTKPAGKAKARAKRK